MSISDFESDTDYQALDGVQLSNDDEGHLLLNVEEVETFDPRISNDVEGLLFLGKLTATVNVFDHTFVLRTLTRGERLAVTQYIRDYEDTLGVAEALQTAYLALAIASLDGRPLSLALSDEERDPFIRLEANFKIVSKWYDPVLESLYVEYTTLLRRQNDAFVELEGKSMASRRSQP